MATAMIPFLENDDATRALMGSNMQRQAVPLLVPEAPIVGTGMEYKAAHDSRRGDPVRKQSGVVDKVSGERSRHPAMTIGELHTYHLSKFARSNQGTCINQRPRVKPRARSLKRATCWRTAPPPRTARSAWAATCSSAS